MEFEWNIFQDSIRLQFREEVNRLLLRLDETPENFTGRIIPTSMYKSHFLWIKKTTKKNAWRMPNSYFCSREDLEKEHDHLLVLVLKRSGTVSVKTIHKVNGKILLKGCWWNSQKADVQFSALRAHCPEVSSKDTENCRFIIVPIWKRLRLIFRTISSVNQICFPGAVAEMCEEFIKNFQDRTEKPVVRGQSNFPFVSSVIK